jgi:hypothetical protein
MKIKPQVAKDNIRLFIILSPWINEGANEMRNWARPVGLGVSWYDHARTKAYGPRLMSGVFSTPTPIVTQLCCTC